MTPGGVSTSVQQHYGTQVLERLVLTMYGVDPVPPPQALEQYLHVSSLAALASSLVHSGQLPDRFNTLIQPLMNCLRREPQLRLQVGASLRCRAVKTKEQMASRSS